MTSRMHSRPVDGSSLLPLRHLETTGPRVDTPRVLMGVFSCSLCKDIRSPYTYYQTIHIDYNVFM